MIVLNQFAELPRRNLAHLCGDIAEIHRIDGEPELVASTAVPSFKVKTIESLQIQKVSLRSTKMRKQSVLRPHKPRLQKHQDIEDMIYSQNWNLPSFQFPWFKFTAILTVALL